MSLETKAALDQALAAHVQDICGGMVTNYVIQAAYFSTDTIDNGTTGYFREFAEDQPFHNGYGLASMLIEYYRDPARWDDDEDEE